MEICVIKTIYLRSIPLGWQRLKKLKLKLLNLVLLRHSPTFQEPKYTSSSLLILRYKPGFEQASRLRQSNIFYYLRLLEKDTFSILQIFKNPNEKAFKMLFEFETLNLWLPTMSNHYIHVTHARKH